MTTKMVAIYNYNGVSNITFLIFFILGILMAIDLTPPALNKGLTLKK